MAVFVLDRIGKPLMPCSEKRARRLLAHGRARVHRVVPFVIRLVDRRVSASAFQPLRVKLDPGSKVSGLALVRETASGAVAVLNLFELVHRGRQISAALAARRAFRRRRRSANLRYREPRFMNRRRPQGWLAPSLRHRLDTTMTWIRRCIYCDCSDQPLQIEHLSARARGGSNRIGNLGLACSDCNLEKGVRDVREYVRDPVRLARILGAASRPLADAAAVNATRWALRAMLEATGLLVETGTGGLTKFNRARFGLPKTHALDAVCVGPLEAIIDWCRPTLTIMATGRGSYQRTRLTRHGFPRGYLMRRKRVHDFQTGDRVRAEVPSGKKAGCHVGRIAIRASSSFNIQTPVGIVQGVRYRYCRLVQRADGYGYILQPTDSIDKGEVGAGRAARDALSLPGLTAGVPHSIG